MEESLKFLLGRYEALLKGLPQGLSRKSRRQGRGKLIWAQVERIQSLYCVVELQQALTRRASWEKDFLESGWRRCDTAQLTARRSALHQTEACARKRLRRYEQLCLRYGRPDPDFKRDFEALLRSIRERKATAQWRSQQLRAASRLVGTSW